MPVYFWNDPRNKKYNEAYFSRFPNISVWAQHDWIQFNPRTGGAQIHGRSDGTLNPSGIRFGSSEIYALIESAAFHERILDTLCVGRKRPADRDEIVFLFVKMKGGEKLTDELRDQIVDTIKRGLSPRHIPRFIIQIADIPVTINGKKVEIAVKKIISGMDVKASSTVANPECLEEYIRYRDLEEKKMAKL
jgi:acetoacetyl-CoA synthetase